MGLKANIRTGKSLSASIGGRDTTPAKWKGEWNAETEYTALEKVSRLGSSYVCLQTCAGVDPAEDVGEGVEGQCWLLIAKRGEQGAAFTYADFTAEQLEGLKGRPFTYADFTQEQLEALRGRAFTYDDFTTEQLEALKGRPFTYDDFTAAQLEALRGHQGVGIKKIEMTGFGWIPGYAEEGVQVSNDKMWTQYTITYTDDTTFEFQVTDGADGIDGKSPTVSVTAITGGHRVSITDKNGTETFDVMDGKDGDGAGDMTASVYDPKGKKTDIFAYAEQLVQGLATRLNALADSDDVTLDQLSEIVAYIKSNKSLIDAITTAKVSVADIVNDLVTDNVSKPLSAAQGVALKALVEAAATAASTAQSTAEGKADVSHKHLANQIQSGTLDGIVAAKSNTAYTTAQLRNIIISNTDASGGSNGQVWIKYK